MLSVLSLSRFARTLLLLSLVAHSQRRLRGQDGDSGCSSGTYRYYYQSYSTDAGSSWTAPRPIHGAGCARPRLLRLEPSGPLLMSGGRLCVENTTGIFLWVNSNAMAALAGGGDGSECTQHRHHPQPCTLQPLTDRHPL